MNFLKPIVSYGANGAAVAQRVSLAPETAGNITVPRRCRLARVTVGQITNYLLTQPGSRTVPSATAGFRLAAGVHDIEVGAGSTLKLFNTSDTVTFIAYVEFFGSDFGPIAPRVKGNALVTALANNNVVHLTADANNFAGATHLQVRASAAIHVSFDAPAGILSANHGIHIPANTTTNIPCYKGDVYVRRVGSSTVNLTVQAFENFETGGNVYGEEVFRPLHHADTNDSTALTSDVKTISIPKDATWAWISANTQDIYYTNNGLNPTAFHGFTVEANATAKVPVVGGSDMLRVLRSAANARVTVCFFALG